MTDPVCHDPDLPPLPDTSHLITENDDPVDNIPSEKNQRLLVGSLYASWEGAPPIEIDGEVLTEGRRSFLATANVGLFDRPINDPLVPDVLVSNDVALGPHEWGPQGTRSYFVWEQGKPPELVIELVSNKKGGELAVKRLRYAQMRVAHYVVFDPAKRLGDRSLRAFKLAGDRLEPVAVAEGALVEIESLGLKLGPWEGTFEQQTGTWLRFWDLDGELLLTGDEKAEAERHKAEAERQKADLLAAKLRELGVDPDAL
ncbi:MAG: Uma2 family endonuclease [Myxococcota bacterium]